MPRNVPETLTEKAEQIHSRSALREGIMQGIAELAKQRFMSAVSKSNTTTAVQKKPVVPIDSDLLQVADDIRAIQRKVDSGCGILSSRQTSKLFDCTTRTVQSWVRRGQLTPGLKHGTVTCESILKRQKELASPK